MSYSNRNKEQRTEKNGNSKLAKIDRSKAKIRLKIEKIRKECTKSLMNFKGIIDQKIQEKKCKNNIEKLPFP